MLSVLFLVSTQAAATDIPREFRGLWLTGKSCGEVTGFGLFANDFGLTGSLAAGKDDKFTLYIFGKEVVTEAKPDRLVVRLPSSGKSSGDNFFVREIKDGHLTSYSSSAPDKRTDGFHCASPAARDPHALVVTRMLSRLDTFVRAYSDIADKCSATVEQSPPCLAQIVALIDVNGDGKIAPAEVTTFLRHYAPAMILFGDKDAKVRQGYRTVIVDPDDLAGIEAAAAIFGPFLTNIVFSNFDYDGNGFLSAAEIGIVLKQEGVPGGAGEAIRMLSESREQAEGALGAVGGLTDMLGPKTSKGHTPIPRPELPGDE